jgi:septal ring factor EnvC (AmiA/AmiB activator)
VTIHQPMDDVHAALIDYLKRSVLTPAVLETVVSAIRDEVAKLVSAGSKDVTVLERDLASLRAEQKCLARAVATAGADIPELVAELRVRNDRIRRLEADLAASRRTPDMVADVLAHAEAAARAKLADLRTALTADLPAMREVFQALFPEGLTFRPAPNTPRRVWAISGTARLDWKYL